MRKWINSTKTNIIGLQRGEKMANKFYEQLQEQSEGDWVKVVRCKDCKYADEAGLCGNVVWYNTEDDFCSHGERKEDGQRDID